MKYFVIVVKKSKTNNILWWNVKPIAIFAKRFLTNLRSGIVIWALIKELINKKKVRDTFNTFVINEELTSDKVK